MIAPSAFLTTSLRTAPWGSTITRILADAIDSVDPSMAVRHFVKRQGSNLIIDQHEYYLPAYERVFVVGAGKAGRHMALTTAELLGDFLTSGIVIVKDDPLTNADTTQAEQDDAPSPYQPLTIYTAGHPLPDQRGVVATQHIINLLQKTTEHDLVIILISGGGSALLTHPAPGITLDDMQQLTSHLLASGARIEEINTLRKHLDSVKGGGLANIAAPATTITLLLSDVVGNSLDIIASGPTVPDRTTFGDAYAVLERYHLGDIVPASIRSYLQKGIQGDIAENPKPGESFFTNTQHILIGSNRQAATAALMTARAEGLNSTLLTTYAQGEASGVGMFLAGIAREMASGGVRGLNIPSLLPSPACLIVGGETTVTIRGTGKGGRNQELALAAVQGLAYLPNTVLVTLATDGNDGPTDAAGAVVTGSTLLKARALHLDPQHALANNDSYHFFDALGDLLKPGMTGTNVNDLAFVFAF